MKLELIFKEMGKFIELKRSHELFSQNIRFLKKLFKFLKKMENKSIILSSRPATNKEERLIIFLYLEF